MITALLDKYYALFNLHIRSFGLYETFRASLRSLKSNRVDYRYIMTTVDKYNATSNPHHNRLSLVCRTLY